MIYSRIERIATIGVALFMICAAMAYLYFIGSIGMESTGNGHYKWESRSVADLILIMSPAALLVVYALLLLKFYRLRGMHTHNMWSELDGSPYKGDKFPDL